MRIRSKIAFFTLVLLTSTMWDSGRLKAQPSTHPASKSIVLGLLLEDSTMVEARYGAQFAVNEINRNGGIENKQIVLSVKSMEGPWGVGSKKAVDLVFDQKAWALIGLLNGRNSHLVEQVAAKTDIPFVSAWAADPTLSKAYVPQFFNCVPNSEQQGRAILNDLLEKHKSEEWILVSDENYDSQIAVESLKKLDDFHKNPASDELKCNSSEDFDALIQKISEKNPKALVVYCKPELSLDLIRFLRVRGVRLPVYSSLSLLDERTYSRLVSDYFEEVYFFDYGTWMTDRDSDFVRQFHNEYGRDPGAMAANAYDAIQILAQALVKSDSDPKKLKQSLSKTSYKGKTGTIEFDRFGNRKSTLPPVVVSSKRLYASKP